MDFIDLKAQYSLNSEQINRRILAVLEHGCYIMGPEVAELEEQLASFVGVKHAIGVANGTDALLIALMALDIQPGDEVITTPFSFAATTEMICLLKAKPVYVDIEPETYNLNPDLLEAAITPKTKAILPVSLYGQCADMRAINEVAGRHVLPVIEDAAQSFGATHHGKKSCGLSTIACTSFFPSKPLGCYGDGGACFTNDDGLAEKMRKIRVHGQEKRYHHDVIGLNGRLDTLQAAILLVKLEIFEDEIQKRQVVAERYHQLLGEYVRIPTILPFNTSVYAQYTIRVPKRELFREQLSALNIPTAVHYPIPLYRQKAFAHSVVCEVTEQAAAEVMSLPMHPYLSEADQEKIVYSIQSIIQELRE